MVNVKTRATKEDCWNAKCLKNGQFEIVIQYDLVLSSFVGDFIRGRIFSLCFNVLNFGIEFANLYNELRVLLGRILSNFRR